MAHTTGSMMEISVRVVSFILIQVCFHKDNESREQKQMKTKYSDLIMPRRILSY